MDSTFTPEAHALAVRIVEAEHKPLERERLVDALYALRHPQPVKRCAVCHQVLPAEQPGEEVSHA